MRRQRGFTFLETMIVIVILAVLIATVLPNMAGPRERQSLRSATGDIASAGLLARQLAIVEGRQTALVFKPAEAKWHMDLSSPGPEPLFEERRRRNRDDAKPGERDEERERKFPNLVELTSAKQNEEDLDLAEEEIRIRFFPNGTSSGIQLEVGAKSDKTMTVDFDRVTGKPEIYAGAPKSFAKKLREQGLDPALFGYSESLEDLGNGPKPGEGFSRTSGWNEDERVDYYKDIAERIMDRAKARDTIQREGADAYYSGAQRWGN